MSVTVLVVEDDMWLAGLEIDVLESAGFQVIHAAHAPSAIEKVDEAIPDVIIVDLLLTGTTAIALLHELQSHTDTKHVPVVVCTNMADSLSLEELAPYGVKRILDKTVMHPDDLAVAVRKVLA